MMFLGVLAQTTLSTEFFLTELTEMFPVFVGLVSGFSAAVITKQSNFFWLYENPRKFSYNLWSNSTLSTLLIFSFYLLWNYFTCSRFLCCHVQAKDYFHGDFHPCEGIRHLRCHYWVGSHVAVHGWLQINDQTGCHGQGIYKKIPHSWQIKKNTTLA